MRKLLGLLILLSSHLALAQGIGPGPGIGPFAGASAPTQIVACPSGFNGTGCNASSINLAASATRDASSPYEIDLTGAVHSAGAAWLMAQQNISSGWMTDFVIQHNETSLQTESMPNGNGTVGPYTYTTTYQTLVPGTVSVTSGGVTCTDSATHGVLAGTGCAAGSYVYYASGDVSVTFSSSITSGTAITVTYNAVSAGGTFTIQDTNATTNPAAYGDNLSSDANGLGHGAIENLGQAAVANSAAVVFDSTSFNYLSMIGQTPSTTRLLMNGGPDVGYFGMAPGEDMNPYSLLPENLDQWHVWLTYDGSDLVMVAQDLTHTSDQIRRIWPIALGTVVGGSTAWVGFTGGTVTPASFKLYSWNFYEGYYPRLSSPTITPAAGVYSSTQTATVTCPSGATCYCTTNGLLPTTTSGVCSGSYTISASEILSAIAVEANKTDSFPTQNNYTIETSTTYQINFPSGFAGASGLLSVNGSATLSAGGSCKSGTCMQLVDSTNYSNIQETGAIWYPVPINIGGNWSTVFTLNFASGGNARYGVTFTLQNYVPSSQDGNGRSYPLVVTGGPNALGALGPSGNGGIGLGSFGILSSVTVGFDLEGNYAGNQSLVSMVTNGAVAGEGVGASTSPVNMQSGDPIKCTLSYNASTTTLSLTMVDTTTSQTFGPTSWTVNIPSVVGGSTAYVGFTGEGPNGAGTLDVQNWYGF